MSNGRWRAWRDVVERQFDILDASKNPLFLPAIENEPFMLSSDSTFDRVWIPCELELRPIHYSMEGLGTAVETENGATWFVIEASSSLRSSFIPFLIDVLTVSREVDMPIAFDLVLEEWRELWKGKNGKLGLQQQRGLLGELLVLYRLLEHEPGAIMAWCGPLRELHDFSSPKGHLEVKTTLRQPPSVRISQIGQVAPLAGEVFLELIVVLLQQNGEHTLPKAVDACRELLHNRQHIEQFERVLRKSGYREEHNRFYSTTYAVSDVLRHTITAESPVLKPSVLRLLPGTFVTSPTLWTCLRWTHQRLQIRIG